MPAVAFDLPAFRAAFPSFASLADPQIEALANEARLFYNPDTAACPADHDKRAMCYLLAVAHLLHLRLGPNGAGPSALVGRVGSASQGSVSVSAALDGAVGGGAAWWLQSQHGASFWKATSGCRGFRWVPARGGRGCC